MKKLNIKRPVNAGIAIASLALAGCGAASGGQSPAPPNQVNPNSNILQLAVGTANIYGTTGLNVVVTYRQPTGGQNPGASGALVSSPTLTIPGALPSTAGSAGGDPLSTITTGPAPIELGGNALTSTSQSPSATTVTTFGQSGGAFGLGLEPFNYTVNGVPFTNVPYPIPLYDSTATDPNQIPAAWGGVPAFDLLGTGQAPNGSAIVPAGAAGISEGIDAFEITPVAGTYSLNVSIPANTGTVSETATATLGSTAPLPAVTAPVYTPDANGDGGATFGVTLPSAATEAYINVIDLGSDNGNSCNGSNGSPVFYTIVVQASGTYQLAPTSGPGGTPSVCTAAQNTAANGGTATDADAVATWVIGFDYPAYEASYPSSKGNPQPTIVGPSGQSDLTMSPLGGTAAESGARLKSFVKARLHQLQTLHYRRSIR